MLDKQTNLIHWLNPLNAVILSISRSSDMFSPQSRLRHAVADTFAMVVYCSVVNMVIEIVSLWHDV